MISEFWRFGFFFLIRCIFTSNKPVIYFNAIFETPLRTVIEMNLRNSIEHEEKCDKGCRRIPRFATGEVLPEGAMLAAEEAFVSYLKTESNVFKRSIPVSFYARKICRTGETFSKPHKFRIG